MLNLIDAFSKYAWSKKLKNNMAKAILEAFKRIIKNSKRQTKFIWVDEGKEFYNKMITAQLCKHKITRYSTHSEHKSTIIERFNRTLKTSMWKKVTLENTRTWIDVIDKIVNEYNNRKHLTIKMTLIEVSKKKNEEVIFKNVNKKIRTKE